MQLLLFNLAIDVDHPMLGFTSRWVEAIAAHVEHIHVITMFAGNIQVLSNVTIYSLGLEKNYSEPRRAIRFYNYLCKILYENKISACFSHMIPILSIMAFPILRLWNIPIITWYAHPSVTQTLKISHKISNRVVTSVPNAYPYKHDKLVIIGQGIDTSLFHPSNFHSEESQIILCVGRLSPVKDHPTLLNAIYLLKTRGVSIKKVVILGTVAGVKGVDYKRFLQELANKLQIDNVVEFLPAVTMEELPSWYRQCTVHVNLTPTGFGDKVAWEAMSCGRPCLVANTDFAETLGDYKDMLLFQYQNPVDLADHLEWILTLSENERLKIGAYLREQVLKLHSLEKLVIKLLDVIQSC